MKRLMIALAALSAAVPAMAAPSGPIEHIAYYYDDDNYRVLVGSTTYYCDSTTVTTGLVTSSEVDVYYTCP